jgi:hypothetical protein
MLPALALVGARRFEPRKALFHRNSQAPLWAPQTGVMWFLSIIVASYPFLWNGFALSFDHECAVTVSQPYDGPQAIEQVESRGWQRNANGLTLLLVSPSAEAVSV